MAAVSKASALGTLSDLGVLWGRRGLGEMSVKTGWSWGEMGTPKSETRCGQGDEGRSETFPRENQQIL